MKTIRSFCFLVIILVITNLNCISQNEKFDITLVPGTVINHSPAFTKVFIGSPSIVVLPNGYYLASYDYFGPGSKYSETAIYQSVNRGESWEKLALLQGQFWSTLFFHRGSLYIIGTSGHYVNIVIRKSLDEGKSWTTPLDENTGLLAEGIYHCAPVPVVEHNGRIWRAFEHRIDVIPFPENDGSIWRAGQHDQDEWYRESLMISAPAGSDLLKRSSWTFSNHVKFNEEWSEEVHDWLEGNAVVTPDGKIVNIIRLSPRRKTGIHSIAAMINISDDGQHANFDPADGIIQMPGGTLKFTIRFDEKSDKYWALTNWIQPKNIDDLKDARSGKIRNTQALISSNDLYTWTIERIVLHHPEFKNHAFQYLDWLIEGDDIIAVSRTAYDDGLGGADSHHNANFITFHRIKNFRHNFNLKNDEKHWIKEY